MLLNELGFAESETANNVNKGSTLTLRSIMDSLPLTDCRSTFIKARDAILLAELNVTHDKP
jgi:hypothetical protein